MSKSRLSRRGAAAAATGAGSVAVFPGPWKHNRVWAQATDKPIRLGMTSDASGHIREFRLQETSAASRWRSPSSTGKGGVLGRKIEIRHIDTETTPPPAAASPSG